MRAKERLVSLLKELFRFDKSELDFGIYRIMNHKKEEIEKFIEKDLIEHIDNEMENLISYEKEHLNNDENLNKIDTNIYNDIYRFFKRYYDNGDFLSKRRYSKEEKYAIPYNGEEIYLYWANNDQYYVKTTEEFDNYTFIKNSVTVNFKVVQAEENKNNNKNEEDRYFILADEDFFEYDSDNRTLNIYFEYRSLTENEEKKFNSQNTQDDIREKAFDKLEIKIKKQTKDIYDLGWLINSDNKVKSLLESHLYKYTTKNTSDYFIHKDLKGFLTRELDFFIKNEIIDVDAIGTENEKNMELYLNKVRVIKNITRKIINFLAQIEDFQKKLFEKKKFVIDSEYCLTLDIVPEEVREEIFDEVLNNQEQLDEWEELYGEKVESRKDLFLEENNLFDDGSLKNLVIDTKYFSTKFKELLLININNIDNNVEGFLIKSENYQGLNLIKNKYKGKVKSIYIDPPYNTKNGKFIYKDNFKHASWLSMMDDRVKVSKNLLKEKGAILISLDNNEIGKLRLLLDRIFGEENYRNTILARRYDKNINTQFSEQGLSSLNVGAENVIIYANSEEFKMNPVYREPSKERKNNGYWKGFWNSADRPTMRYELLGVKPNDGQWKWKKEVAYKAVKNYKKYLKEYSDEMSLEEYWEKTGKQKKFIRRRKDGQGKNKGVDHWIPPSEGILRSSNWTDILASDTLSFLGLDFDNPKNVEYIKELIKLSSKENDIILDYFSGSGTTGEAVLRMNYDNDKKRKYIQMEMGNYFYTLILPRMKKIMFSRNWSNGEPDDNEGISHMFKYIVLEQYEDTLENIEFEGNQMQLTDNFDDYLLKYMLNYETKSSVLNIEEFKDPFNYEMIIKEDKEEKRKKVNLVETFNYLIGLHVNQIDVFESQNRKYKIVKGQKDEDNILVIWRKTEDLDLEKDKLFIEDKFDLKDYDKIYINCDNYIENSILIEDQFNNLLFSD